MKKILASFGWILLLLPLISIAGAKTAFNSTNRFHSETRKVSGFHGISSGGSYNVYVSFGNQESLRLEGDEETIANIETVVEDGKLKIKTKKNSSFWKSMNSEDVDIYITAKSLNELTLSGSGSMKVSGTLKAQQFNASVSGSGKMTVAVGVNEYNASVSGSGRINTSGNVNSNTTIKVSGSGDFAGKDLKTKNSDIRVSGSGDASIYTSDRLNAMVSGSGNVYYAGKPDISKKVSGSGNVKNL